MANWLHFLFFLCEFSVLDTIYSRVFSTIYFDFSSSQRLLVLLRAWERGRKFKEHSIYVRDCDSRTRPQRKRHFKNEFVFFSVFVAIILTHLLCLNVGEPSRSWISENHIQVKKSLSCKNGRKEMYKKVRCTCKVVVMPTSIVVFDVLVAVASSDLKVSVFKKREPLRRKEMF